MLSLEEIISELEKNTKFSRKQIYDRIKKKHEELSGLVSLEGAGHLVARDLGVNLVFTGKRELKIKDIVNGMKHINLKARIIQISEIREFDRKDGKKGKVCNLILTDGTGHIRLPLWDKQVTMIEEGKIKEDGIVELKNAFAKENVFGGVELSLPRLARIEKVEDDESIPRETIGKSFKRVSIKDLKEGNYEIKGSIVQIFNVNPVFQTCSECRAKVEKTEDGYECPEHGKVKPENNMIISGISDDGTASIRSVFFRDQARTLTGLDPSVLLSMSQDEAINLIKENALGNEIIIRGRVQKNKIFNTLEIIVNEVEELDIEKESKRLINEIKSIQRVSE
jgi:hypothetical protein